MVYKAKSTLRNQTRNMYTGDQTKYCTVWTINIQQWSKFTQKAILFERGSLIINYDYESGHYNDYIRELQYTTLHVWQLFVTLAHSLYKHKACSSEQIHPYGCTPREPCHHRPPPLHQHEHSLRHQLEICKLKQLQYSRTIHTCILCIVY